MTKRTNGLLALTAAALLGVSVAAQQGQGQNKPQEPGQSGQMSTGDMMKGCREHCQATSKSMAQMAAAMEEAKQSSDPAKMRAAIERMQKPMGEMKEHMGMCMRMMDTMQGMHALDIAFTSQPDPPKTGENTLEVMVKEADGTPLTDAAVTVRFYMAAMPSMNMPEMRSSAALTHVSGGRYRGTGKIAMGGRWDVTVIVTKGGKQIGSRTLTITAR